MIWKWHNPCDPCCEDKCDPYLPCCVESLFFHIQGDTLRVAQDEESQYVMTSAVFHLIQDCNDGAPIYSTSVNMASLNYFWSNSGLSWNSAIMGNALRQRNSFGLPFNSDGLWCRCFDTLGTQLANIMVDIRVVRMSPTANQLDINNMYFAATGSPTERTCHLEFIGAEDLADGANPWDVTNARQVLNPFNGTGLIDGISYQGGQFQLSNTLRIHFGVPLFQCGVRCYLPELHQGRSVMQRQGIADAVDGHPQEIASCFYSNPCAERGTALGDDPELESRQDECDGSLEPSNPCQPCGCWEEENKNQPGCEPLCDPVDCRCQSCGGTLISTPTDELQRIMGGGDPENGGFSANLMRGTWTGGWWHYEEAGTYENSATLVHGAQGFVLRVRGLLGGNEAWRTVINAPSQLIHTPAFTCPTFTFDWNWDAGAERLHLNINIDGTQYDEFANLPGWTPDVGTGQGWIGGWNNQGGGTTATTRAPSICV